LIKHSISFETTPTEAALDIGAVFKLGMETVKYNQPQNGAVSSSGAVTSWPPLSDGTYEVVTWDGKTETLQERVISVASGQTASEGNFVFCVKSSSQTTETYKTQALSYTEDGNISVEATVYPTDDNGASLLSAGWEDSVNWTIEGEIY
jgi:hypothetical protein